MLVILEMFEIKLQQIIVSLSKYALLCSGCHTPDVSFYMRHHNWPPYKDIYQIYYLNIFIADKFPGSIRCPFRQISLNFISEVVISIQEWNFAIQITQKRKLMLGCNLQYNGKCCQLNICCLESYTGSPNKLLVNW